MSFSLEMLTKAADLVETQDQQRLRESPSPTSDARRASNHVGQAKSRGAPKAVESDERKTNGTVEARLHDHVSRNGTAHNNQSKESPRADAAWTVKNRDRNGSKDDDEEENSSLDRRLADRGVLLDPARYYQYQQSLIEQANGIQARVERGQRVEEISTARRSPERYQPAHRRLTSPAVDRDGDTQPATKPMVLLQHPAATTLSTVGSGHTVPLTNPAMHPYSYSFMYPAGTTFDPALSALGRAPGSVLKDGEGQVSPQNGSPNAGIPPSASGMQFPAFISPLASQALMMGARHPGNIADRYCAPLLMAQSSANQAAEQYKRMLEGMQPVAYSLPPQFMDQYLKSLTGQGLENNNDALALTSLAGRIPPGISLAALQGQHGANELLMRYPELNAAMGLLRPQDRISPRSASPYTAKRRTESPVIPNGGKIAASYPYHSSLAQPQLNNLGGARTHARSPANIFPQGHRSRSPATEVERSRYRSHSRDLDRDGQLSIKDVASTSTSGNHIRSIDEQQRLAALSYSVTDHTGLKIVPSYYSGPSVHVPHGYPLGLPLPVHHPGRERSPSPRQRTSDDRSYHHRPSRARSPAAEIQNKKRSFENQFIARNSPVLNDRHSRPTSPTTNGQTHGVRPQLPLVNGGAEAAAELAKASQQHLLLHTSHTRSPNAGPFVGEGREQRSGSPPANPYLAAGMQYLHPQLLGGLAGHAAGSPFLLPQYAALAAKGVDLTSLYKAAENVPDYPRIAGLPSLGGLPLPLSLFSAQQLAGGRNPHVLSQDYAAALQAHPYFASPPGSDERGNVSSPANNKDKIPGIPQHIHPSLLMQQSPQALSPAKVTMKPKHSPSPQLAKPTHHSRTPESHSPPSGVGSGTLSSSEARRYHSPTIDRPARESSPKPSSKPYRPNSMLRQHAEDLERSRKRKLEEKGGREEYYMQEKQHIQSRPEQRDYLVKEARKNPKARKLITGEQPDVEEHFRLSLGKDYKETCNKVNISGSVDDHFKKSLGDSWNKVRTAPSALLVKSESRDSAAHTAAHVLPTYSQSVRGYPPHSDGKEPAARMLDPLYFAAARDRHFTQNVSTQRKAEKSPPRAPAQPASTVLYPPPPIGPVRQKVKAKAFIPEAPPVNADLTNNRSVRPTPLGSKGSSKTINGSSADSLPAGDSKSPPVSYPVSAAECSFRPTLPAIISSAIPYTSAHQQAVQSAASHSAALTGTTVGNSMPRHINPPTSPRAPVPEEPSRNRNSPPQNFPTSTAKSQESGEGRMSAEGKPST